MTREGKHLEFFLFFFKLSGCLMFHLSNTDIIIPLPNPSSTDWRSRFKSTILHHALIKLALTQFQNIYIYLALDLVIVQITSLKQSPDQHIRSTII